MCRIIVYELKLREQEAFLSAKNARVSLLWAWKL